MHRAPLLFLMINACEAKICYDNILIIIVMMTLLLKVVLFLTGYIPERIYINFTRGSIFS